MSIEQKRICQQIFLERRQEKSMVGLSKTTFLFPERENVCNFKKPSTWSRELTHAKYCNGFIGKINA